MAILEFAENWRLRSPSSLVLPEPVHFAGYRPANFRCLRILFSSSCTPPEAQSDHHLHGDSLHELRGVKRAAAPGISRSSTQKWRSRFPSSRLQIGPAHLQAREAFGEG